MFDRRLLYDLLKNLSLSLSCENVMSSPSRLCKHSVNVQFDLSFCRIRTRRRHLAQERLSSGISDLSDTAQCLRLTIRIIKSAICRFGRSAGASFTISANEARSILNGTIVLRYGKSRGFLRVRPVGFCKIATIAPNWQAIRVINAVAECSSRSCHLSWRRNNFHIPYRYLKAYWYILGAL